jgi:branched-chain amino acid transport system permease protein
MIMERLLLVISDFIATFSVYAIIVLSLNLESGYCGIPNFGKVLAILGGALIVAVFPGRIMAWYLGLDFGLGYVRYNAEIITKINYVLSKNPILALMLFILTLAVSIGVGAVIGLISFYPTKKLRAIFLAIVLFATGEILRIILHTFYPIVGGSIGVMVPDVFAFLPAKYRFSIVSFIMFSSSLIIFLYIKYLTNSPLGRTLRAIRDDDDAARTFGKDINKIRAKTIAVSAVIASFAGALYTFYTGAMIAVAFGAFSWTFIPWLMMIIGGIGNNIGVIIGVSLITIIRKVLVYYKHFLAPFIPFDVIWLEPLLTGVVLILVLLYRPAGILKERPIETIHYSDILDKIKEKIKS